MSGSYVYEELPIKSSIRLIKILSEKKEGKVVCILQHFHQAEAPPYCALSYVWGDIKPVGSIYLGDDPDHVYSRPLHESLLEFLGRMWQQQRFEEFFWTDSLCLNQKDEEEKSKQVSRMGEIYTNAKQVLIWLGHEDEKEQKMRVIQGWPAVDWEALPFQDTDAWENALQVENERAAIDGETWSRAKDAAIYLLLLPYWSRVWIVQEVALSREAVIACGNTSLELDLFRIKVDEFRDTRPEFNWQPTIWTLCDLRRQQGKKPLWALLGDFALAQSTFPVDRVYGFLGLVEQSDSGISFSDSITVEYRKTELEVFWNAVFECGALWNEYSTTVLYLGYMVPDPQFGRLGNYMSGLKNKYLKNPWTSKQHIILAEIVLHVLEIICIYVRETAMTLEDWRRVTESVFLEPSEKNMEFQNAAIVALVLSRSLQGMPNTEKGWDWGRPQTGGDVESVREPSHQLLWLKKGVELTATDPKTVSTTSFPDHLHLEIQSSTFQLAVSLGTGHGSERLWSVSLYIKNEE